ncbi:MAG: hypothetical protein AB8D78_03905 [Akkermansiaceae bacterium]
MKNHFLNLGSIVAATIIFNSCGGSGDNSLNDAIGGPADASGFAGSVVSFNPTLRFREGGVVEYVNTQKNSQFPTAPRNSPSIGTYTYSADAGFLTGTLTLTLPNLSGGVTEVIPLTDISSKKGVVRSFVMNFENEGPFVAVVESGTIPAAGTKPTSGGNTTSPNNEFAFSEDGNIATGTTFTKANTATVYAGFYGGGSLTYSPLEVRPVGGEQTFTIAPSGNIEFPGIDRKGSGFFDSGASYTLSIPFVGAEDGILSYRGFDSASGGTMLITFDTEVTNVLTIRWDDNFFSDYEQQSYE